jgi:hypothetical protein
MHTVQERPVARVDKRLATVQALLALRGYELRELASGEAASAFSEQTIGGQSQ